MSCVTKFLDYLNFPFQLFFYKCYQQGLLRRVLYRIKFFPLPRGQCYAFEGKKRLLSWFRGYLTVVSDEGPDKVRNFSLKHLLIQERTDDASFDLKKKWCWPGILKDQATDFMFFGLKT